MAEPILFPMCGERITHADLRARRRLWGGSPVYCVERPADVLPAMAGLILRRARPRSPQCRSRLFGRRDASELRRLALEQATIDAAGSRGKRGVGTLFDDLAAIEHQNTVEAAYR
jgi:hypothetical protein